MDFFITAQISTLHFQSCHSSFLLLFSPSSFTANWFHSVPLFLYCCRPPHQCHFRFSTYTRRATRNPSGLPGAWIPFTNSSREENISVSQPHTNAHRKRSFQTHFTCHPDNWKLSLWNAKDTVMVLRLPVIYIGGCNCGGSDSLFVAYKFPVVAG